jgi:hypothetical protein
MSTLYELNGKETFLDQHRQELLDSAARTRQLNPSRLSTITSPEKRERIQVLSYRFAYILILVFFVTMLVVEVVEAVSGIASGGGGGSFHLVR